MTRQAAKRTLAVILAIACVISSVPFINQPATATVQGSGRTVYGEGTVATPRTRELRNQDTTWLAEASLPTAGGTVSRVIVKASPTRDEMVAGVVAGTVLTVYRWDGATETWSSQWTVTGMTNTNMPRFDIAYEDSSGDVLVFYSKNVATTNELAYRVYNGTSWSGETLYNASRTSGTILYVAAKARPGANDEIGLIWMDSNLDLSANYWTGSAFAGEPAAALSSGVSVVSTATVPTTRSADLAFESVSGELLVCWGSGAIADLSCQSRTAGAGGAWGSTTTDTTFAKEPTDFQMSSEPGTDYIAYANATDVGADAEAAIWNGTAWGNFYTAEITIGTIAAGTIAIAVEWTQSGAQSRAVIVYEDSAAAGFDHLLFNKNTSTWSAPADYTTAPAPVTGNDREFLIRRNPFNAAELMVMVVDNGSDLFAKRLTFDGTNFTWAATEPGATALEASVTTAGGMGWVADFVYNEYIPTGTLTSDIVDSGGVSVGSPSVVLSAITANFTCQSSTGTLGISNQKIRVSNTTTNDLWTLSIAPTGGATANWSSGLNTYDFNDAGGAPAGCTDSGDADSLAGRLSINPSAATMTSKSVCSNTGVSLGSSSAFNQGSTDNITIASASASATYDCYWDITDVTLSQQIPSSTGDGTYNLPMTLTLVAN